jgi:hypothetical protein
MQMMPIMAMVAFWGWIAVFASGGYAISVAYGDFIRKREVAKRPKGVRRGFMYRL